MVGDAGADLGRVAVGRLLAEEEQVHGTELPDRERERVAGRPGVRAAELAAADQDAVRGAAGEGLADRGLGLGRTHCDDSDGGAGDGVLEAQGDLEGVLVERVDDGGDTGAVEPVGRAVDGHLVRVGDLLDADDDLHAVSWRGVRNGAEC